MKSISWILLEFVPLGETMKICSFGSINIDHVYTVPHFVKPGETLDTSSYSIFPGGKGLNQSIALARSGADVFHAGALGKGGEWLLNLMGSEGIGYEHVLVRDEPGGHAVIQVTPTGENAIFIHGGANRTFSKKEITSVISCFSEGDYLLLQNEINNVPFAIREASKKKLTVVFNPAPMDADVHAYPLELVDVLILNEIEGAELSGESDYIKIVKKIQRMYPESSLVLTLGSQGVIYNDRFREFLKVPALKVKAVDTTAAGDTFIGYFIGLLSQNISPEEALRTANKAAALCVTIPGAASSIPDKSSVINFIPEIE